MAGGIKERGREIFSTVKYICISGDAKIPITARCVPLAVFTKRIFYTSTKLDEITKIKIGDVDAYYNLVLSGIRTREPRTW